MRELSILNQQKIKNILPEKHKTIPIYIITNVYFLTRLSNRETVIHVIVFYTFFMCNASFCSEYNIRMYITSYAASGGWITGRVFCLCI